MTSLLPEMPGVYELGQNDDSTAEEILPILPECKTTLSDSWPILSELGMTKDRLAEIRFELTRAMSLEYLHMTTPSVSQIIPEEQVRYHGDSWLRELIKCRENDPEHYKKIVSIYNEARYRGQIASKAVGLYAAYSFGSPISLGPSLSVIESSMSAPPENRTVVVKDSAKSLPNLMDFIYSMGYIRVDKVLCLSFLQHQGIQTHVDFKQITNYWDLSVAIFDKPSQPFYIWDSINRKKIYSAIDSEGFIFNSRSWHGVDPQNRPSWILRIDGQPTKELSNKVKEIYG
jgi:hypothetical protein